MPLYEYWNVGDAALVSCRGDFWQAQTFTPLEAHTVESVKLRMYRVGEPGMVAVAIRATDVDGHPTGGDLASGITDGDTLPVSYSGEWREVSLGDGVALAADTKYAIVVRAAAGDVNNYVRWRWSGAAPYPRGTHEFSSDAGANWETDGGRDLMFEEWGSP